MHRLSSKIAAPEGAELFGPGRESWVSVFRMASAVGAAQEFLSALRFAARESAAQGVESLSALTARLRSPLAPFGRWRAKRSSRELIRAWTEHKGVSQRVCFLNASAA